VNTAAKLGAFAAVLAIAFGGAAAVGAAVGPVDTASEGVAHDMHVQASASAPRGLAIAADGYRLQVDRTDLVAGATTTFGFSIVDDHGVAVTEFEQLHERPLHLIVLSRNLVDYWHLHPAMDATGHWTVDVPALQPGSYRVFADFQSAGADNLTLGADVVVAGDTVTVDVPAAADLATIDDYTVHMSGTPAVGDTDLTFTVVLDGTTVRTDPYLGAAGHLVAIRQGDLAYLHVHPHGGTTPQVTFTGEFPTAGTYRLFFDFSHDGSVHTAAFTVVVPDGG
jgi:hypothetical protein